MSDKPGELAETFLADGIGTWAESKAGGDGPPGLSPGTLLAQRWELEALLGVGGMGSVYRARDRELDELVAVKVLRRELAAAPEMVERFRREVKLARRVTHPNVARTFDIGEAGPLRFLTMELLDGVALSAILKRAGPMRLERVAPIVRAVCAGLAAAHEAGVIHRDLKPDNVLCERSGRIAITDFGIARALAVESASGDTQNAVLGTPLYMAPEQIAHDAPIGPAADVYALGCMLFELVTGEPPWRGPNPLATAAARLLASPPDARSRVPDVPEPLAELILRMMARDPAARPASALEVGDAIAAMAPGATVGPSVPPPRPSSPTSPPPTQPREVVSSGLLSAAKTLAVLPIENRSVAEDAYLAAALTDDLVDLLSATPGVRVRPRAVAERAARSAEATGRDPREVGRDLDVQVVVSGEVRRHAGKLQANVRLLTVEDGFQLWARRFTTDPADFLSIGDEAAASIAQALRARPVAPREALHPEALDLFLRGRYLLQRTWGSSQEAAAVLARAVALAPHDPRIAVTYARALMRGFAMGSGGDEIAQEAGRLVDGALAADPRSADARLARSSLHLMRGEWIAAMTDLRAALELQPDLPEAVALLGDILVDCDGKAAAVVLERALTLAPGYFTPRLGLMRIAGLRRDFTAARAVLGEPPPDHFDIGGYWLGRVRLAMWARDRADAAVIRDAIEPLGFSPMLRSILLATTAAVLGTSETPPEEQLRRIGGPSRNSPRMATYHQQYQAEVLSTFGAPDAAMSSLIGADSEGCFDVRWADGCPALDPLRAHPAFAEVRERIALRAERIRLALGDLASTGVG